MSEKLSHTDILQPLPIEKWPLLQSKIKYNWPLFAHYYYWVENAITWKRKYPDIPIQLYCPNGNYESGTFIGISQVSPFLELTGKTLKEALMETRYIDWHQGVHFAAVHELMFPIVHSTVKLIKIIHNIESYPITPTHVYFKSAEECAKVDIHVPEGCYLKVLDVSNVSVIHDAWPHKDLNRPDLSTKYLSSMIEMNTCIGLFLKKDNSLVSWALHTDWNGMGMVQTLEEYKRKGYAKIAVNALAKNLGKIGISTTLFILDDNIPSQTMFGALGWKSVAQTAWIVLNRKTATA